MNEISLDSNFDSLAFLYYSIYTISYATIVTVLSLTARHAFMLFYATAAVLVVQFAD